MNYFKFSLILLLAAASLIACKKEYTCSCTYHQTGQVIEAHKKEKNKSKAQEWCDIISPYNDTTVTCSVYLK